MEAALEDNETKIPKVNKNNLFKDKSVNLQEIRKRIKQKIGIGEKTENGEKHNFIIPVSYTHLTLPTTPYV